MKSERGRCGAGRNLALAIAALSLCVLARAQPKYKVLHNFNGPDGAGPWGGVTFDGNGNLYGTTPAGGDGNGCIYQGGCGVVFKLIQKRGVWAETVLYDFGPGDVGIVPYGGVALDASGNIYGTTVYGGANNHGAAFELAPTSDGWSESVLYSFCQKSECADGGSPQSAPTLDGAGNLFGGAGVAYELTPGSGGWQELVLNDFTGENGNGSDAVAAVIVDSAGNLYGTTDGGGAYGGGTVYKLAPPYGGGGWKETILHSFAVNYRDGHTPGWGAVFMDKSGGLYGTTAGGGCCGGVVYKLTRGSGGHWKETIIYEFQGGASGYEPNAGVVMDKAGTLYGTTDYGGVGCGVIYKLDPGTKGKWRYTVLHTFGIGSDGCIPEGNLVLDKKGNLYGGTVLGGTTGNGVVFEITP